MDIALQLWSIHEEVEADFAKALELTQKAGYQGVEFAGYQGLSPEQIGELLKKYNLKAVGSHVGLDRLHGNFDEELRYAKQLGFKLLVCPWSDCKTKEGIIADAQFLESCARKAAEDGITLGYHNHNQEFAKFDGRYGLDILLENMPSVKFEPDVYWIAYAGLDFLAYLKPLAEKGRICAIHAKELAKEGKDNVYIGQGKMDFKGLAALVDPSKYPFIVEQEEYSGDHFDGISQSFKGLLKSIS